APAEKADDVERLDLAKQLCAGVGLGALQRLLEQRHRLEACAELLRPVDDLADADDDGNAVFRNACHCCCFSLLRTGETLILRSAERASRRIKATDVASWFETALTRLLTMRNSIRHQRVHVLDGLDKLFLEFLHHGAGRL